MARPLLLVMMCALALSTASGQVAWRALFDGRTLAGWSVLNGEAPFRVEEGAIVGVSVTGSPNSFLCTQEEFGDFILEFESKIEDGLNSGVQIRSRTDAAYKQGRVHGYQVEIDASPRRWTGGIYDEARRGWLYTLEGWERARAAFRAGEWNAFRVEAIGSRLRTWVNGVPCADLLDHESARGLIGLQVHSIGRDSAKNGSTVRWRNLRILTSDLPSHTLPEDPALPQENYLPNLLSEREKASGWVLLWDGKTSKGWRGAKLDRFPEGGWLMHDGVLSVLESGGAEARAGGDIVTIREFGNFELVVEFMITRGANSGIKYFVDTGLNAGPGSAIGCEYQILDDAVHEDASKGVNGNRRLAGLYDLIPPENVRFNGVGEWNRARVVSRHGRVQHWLNGMKTVEYERSTQMWRALVDHSKYAVWDRFGERPRGPILLQDHGNKVAFRTIKILPLD
jgi:hypothetical protein